MTSSIPTPTVADYSIEHYKSLDRTNSSPLDTKVYTVEDLEQFVGVGQYAGWSLAGLYHKRIDFLDHPSVIKLIRYGFPVPNYSIEQLRDAIEKVTPVLRKCWDAETLDRATKWRPIIAGGVIESLMTRALKKPSTPTVDIQRDIDVFLIDPPRNVDSPSDATESLEMKEWIKSLTRQGDMVSISGAAITITRDAEATLQLIPSRYTDGAELVSMFDIDACGAYYDGEKIHFLQRTIVSWMTRTFLLRLSASCSRFTTRIRKYFRRGYDCIIPDWYGADLDTIDYDQPRWGGGLVSLLPSITTQETCAANYFMRRAYREYCEAQSTPANDSTIASDYLTSWAPSIPCAWDHETALSCVHDVKLGKKAYYVHVKVPYTHASTDLDDILEGKYPRTLLLEALGVPATIPVTGSGASDQYQLIIDSMIADVEEEQPFPFSLDRLMNPGSKETVLSHASHPSPRETMNWFCLKDGPFPSYEPITPSPDDESRLPSPDDDDVKSPPLPSLDDDDVKSPVSEAAP